MANFEPQRWAPEPTGPSAYPSELQYMEYDEQLQPGGRFSTVSNISGALAAAGFTGYEVLPEEVGLTQGHGGVQLDSQRQAEAAVGSWRVGSVVNTAGSLTSGLNLSTRSSDIDLKNFLMQRGNHPLEGLHRAAAQGDRTGIMHLMKLHGPGAPINTLDSNGCTPLMYAVMADSRLAVEMLLNFSAKREQVDFEGRTAVHYAAFFGKHRSLKFMIESASDWTPGDNYGRTPLHWACATSTTKCLTVLLKHAAVVLGDINLVDNEGMTPLHCAAHFARPKHIILLSEAECDFSVVDVEEKTALHWTSSNPDPACIQALVDAYPPLLNKRDINGSTVLHLTAANGSTHLMDALLKLEGIELDVKDSQECTPLHYACMEGHSKSVELLIDNRAVDSCIDTQGLTALHYAVQRNHLSTLSVLTQFPALTHLPEAAGGRTPLMMAAAGSYHEALKILLKVESIVLSVNSVDTQGQSALHLASEANSPSCVRALLSSGADPNLLDDALQSPLFPACIGGYTNCIQALVVSGSETATLDSEGQSPLHKATLYGQIESVRSLALTGADLNLEDGAGNCAVQMAAYGGSEKILGMLLEKAANPNVQNANGMAALHLAAIEGHTGCVALLMRYRAYLNFMDYSDNRLTPLDYAKLHGHTECIQLLSQNGGVSSDDIYEMAARGIQAAYRGYRARMLRSEHSVQSRAVTVIAKYVRGHLQRQRYKQLQERVYASSIIQAYIRGHLQRVRFRAQLAKYREQEKHNHLMKEFGKKFMQERASLQPLTFSTQAEKTSALQSESEQLADEGRQQKEQKLRLETAMKMRELYLEKQMRWQEFREAERQRRIDKATQEELNRYSNIIKKSQERRVFAQHKFQQTNTVRSYCDAAIIIQRAFRESQERRQLRMEQAKWKNVLQAEQEKRAAVIIQRAWRQYKQYKLYQALHFKAIMTSPVIAVGSHPHPSSSSWGVHSYEKDISITGNPRRKMHQTEQSGFKVFRPATRDLLFKPGSHNKDSSSRPVSNVSTLLQHPPSTHTGLLKMSDEVKAMLTTSCGRSNHTRYRSQFDGSVGTTTAPVRNTLPWLVVTQSSQTAEQATVFKQKSKVAVHLPEIVQSR